MLNVQKPSRTHNVYVCHRGHSPNTIVLKVITFPDTKIDFNTLNVLLKELITDGGKLQFHIVTFIGVRGGGSGGLCTLL